MQEGQLSIINMAILPVNKIEILVQNCNLIGNQTLTCHLTKSVQIHGDTGVVHGYIIVDNPTSIPSLYGVPNNDSAEFKPLDINHVYNSVESNLKLQIEDIIFHNIYLNRYKSVDNVFFFIGKTTIKDLDRFIKKEVNNGQETT